VQIYIHFRDLQKVDDKIESLRRHTLSGGLINTLILPIGLPLTFSDTHLTAFPEENNLFLSGLNICSVSDLS
jgi:hypothetical protein